MKLKEALEIGKACDLYTVEECMVNIELHATQFFPYDKMNEELSELYRDIKEWQKENKI